jgi:hypothetical protein
MPRWLKYWPLSTLCSSVSFGGSLAPVKRTPNHDFGKRCEVSVAQEKLSVGHRATVGDAQVFLPVLEEDL